MPTRITREYKDGMEKAIRISWEKGSLCGQNT
jgi:hypothetical protein